MEKKKVMVTVKTYPNPSKKYEETVCCAGIELDENNNPLGFIRLYPIKFRDLAFAQRFSKYEIREFEIEKNPQDIRSESHKVISIGEIIQSIDTVNYWEKRKKLVDNFYNTMCQLQVNCKNSDLHSPSLGIVKPINYDFYIENTEREWSEEKKQSLMRFNLFDTYRKAPLEKVPRKFRFKFICNDPNCRGHNMMCEDWELYQLWRDQKNKGITKLKYSLEAAEKYADGQVYKKVNTWQEKNDLSFYVGTIARHLNSWVIIGVFYPLKQP